MMNNENLNQYDKRLTQQAYTYFLENEMKPKYRRYYQIYGKQVTAEEIEECIEDYFDFCRVSFKTKEERDRVGAGVSIVEKMLDYSAMAEAWNNNRALIYNE
jgi:hypothetical protein